MIEPKRIGRFLVKDDEGNLKPDVSIGNLSIDWLPVLDFIVDSLFREKLVQGVFVRGSIPRGLAIPRVSDVDIIYISEAQDKLLTRHITQTVALKFPIVSKVELVRVDQAKLNRIGKNRKRPYYHMLLKTQSLCLAGADITQEIPPFKIDAELISHVFSLKEEFEALPEMIAEDLNRGEASQAANQWFSRRLVRSGLEITLNRADRFTRDLYLCFEQFSDYYPSCSNSMFRALQNCLNGDQDCSNFRELVDFLHEESVHLKSGD